MLQHMLLCALAGMVIQHVHCRHDMDNTMLCPSVPMQQQALSSVLTSLSVMGIASLLNQALSLAAKNC